MSLYCILQYIIIIVITNLFILKTFQDKVTIKLFAAMVDSGKIDNAFELVGRLHSEKSFEIAMRYADRHSDKLSGKIEK